MGQPGGVLFSRAQLMKRLVWDIFPHDFGEISHAQEHLGLLPDSDEGMHSEHDASDTRVNRAAVLRPALEVLARCTAEVSVVYLMSLAQGPACTDPGMSEEDAYRGLVEQTAVAVYFSSYAIIAHLLDTGVLEYGRKIRA